MNAPIIDPLQGDFPEVIEEYLEHGCMKCIAFNRRGTLLAAGCNDGSCVIWDFETRGIAKELRDNECSSPITSICWSSYGHRILVSAADKSLILWDVMSGKRITRIVLQQTPIQARLHPGSSTPSVCLACPLSCAPMIVDLNMRNTTSLKVIDICSVKSTPPSRSKCSDGMTPYIPTAVCFNKYGNLVYVGNSKGEILIFDYKGSEVCAMVPISGGSLLMKENKGYLCSVFSKERLGETQWLLELVMVGVKARWPSSLLPMAVMLVGGGFSLSSGGTPTASTSSSNSCSDGSFRNKNEGKILR